MVTEDKIRAALKDVIDPELGVNIVDLGLVYEIKVEEKNVDIKFTLTSPGCPVGPMIMDGIYNAVQQFEELGKVNTGIVWNPPWDPSRMSEEAKDQLGIF